MSAVGDILLAAAKTYEERNELYGDNYKRFGAFMKAAMPNVWQALPGTGSKQFSQFTEHDWNRLGILVQIVAKITRYGEAFERGGHEDSAHDMVVYAAMLEELTIEGRRK